MYLISLALILFVSFPVFGCTSILASFGTQGSTQDRLGKIVKQAIAESKGARFWVVYSFKPRPGIGVDEPEPKVKSTVNKEGLRISLRPASESKNVSVFLLYHGNQIEKVEIHDLDRYRAQDYPVHSLGPVTNAESIALLKSLLPEHAGKLHGRAAGTRNWLA